MGVEREVRVPDIGEVESAEIIVSVGDKVEAGDSLVTIESEKASIEIPCPFGGVVKEICVSVGDRVGEGQVLVVVEAEPGAAKEEALATEALPGAAQEEAPTAEALPPRKEVAPQPAPPPPEAQRTRSI